MRPLRFVALDEDGTHLVLARDVPEAIDNGERFLLPVDDRLRAAARGDMSRLGQIEIELESTLRPRDIQARIRAGETPEQVAAVAGVRVDKVLRYAHPVLQERERLAEQAHAARVRLADGTPASPLGEFMVEKLSLLDVDHRGAGWDARRLADGSWEIVVSWSVGNRRTNTRWWYDVSARTVTPADAETSAFAERPRSGQSMIVAPPAQAAQRTLSALGDGPAYDSPAYDGPAYDEARPAQPWGAVTVEEYPPAPEPARPPVSDDEEREHRARIPSWEDIVFGVRRKRS